MKKVILGFAVAAALMAHAVADAKVGPRDARPAGTDPVIPWPWGAEMPFPWTFVQGVWLAEQDGAKSYFIFRVVKPKSGGLSQLEVQEIDPVTCNVVATGVGYEQSRVVRAQMSMVKGGNYRLALRSFSVRSVQSRVSAKPVNGQYVVLSVVPFDSAVGLNIPIQLITNSLTFKCRVQE